MSSPQARRDNFVVQMRPVLARPYAPRRRARQLGSRTLLQAQLAPFRPQQISQLFLYWKLGKLCAGSLSHPYRHQQASALQVRLKSRELHAFGHFRISTELEELRLAGGGTGVTDFRRRV